MIVMLWEKVLECRDIGKSSYGGLGNGDKRIVMRVFSHAQPGDRAIMCD